MSCSANDWLTYACREFLLDLSQSALAAASNLAGKLSNAALADRY